MVSFDEFVVASADSDEISSARSFAERLGQPVLLRRLRPRRDERAGIRDVRGNQNRRADGRFGRFFDRHPNRRVVLRGGRHGREVGGLGVRRGVDVAEDFPEVLPERFVVDDRAGDAWGVPAALALARMSSFSALSFASRASASRVFSSSHSVRYRSIRLVSSRALTSSLAFAARSLACAAVFARSSATSAFSESPEPFASRSSRVASSSLPSRAPSRRSPPLRVP